MGKQAENIRAELVELGIRTDQDLRDAIKALPPLNLQIMTGVICTRRKGAKNGQRRECDLCG